MTEALIRQRVEGLLKAVRAKDIDGVMAHYAPEVVSFDIDPPLRYDGGTRKSRAWQELFAAYTGPIDYESHDLTIATQGKVAFAHSINHVSGTLAGGRRTDLWLRWTACFCRLGDAWLIVHDHVSVPADLEHGRALLDLTP